MLGKVLLNLLLKHSSNWIDCPLNIPARTRPELNIRNGKVLGFIHFSCGIGTFLTPIPLVINNSLSSAHLLSKGGIPLETYKSSTHKIET